MSTKPNLLRDAMLGVQQADAPKPSTVVSLPERSTAPAPQQPPTPSRVGKRSVSGHFDPAVQRQLRLLSAETDRKIQNLLDEALNDLFRKYNKSAIA